MGVRVERGVLVALAVGTAACSPTFRGEAVQPNPLVSPLETLRTSEKIVVITGDMELNVPRQPRAGESIALLHLDRYPLHNEASFTMVSRDRLRFHVQLEHKWQDWADLGNWQVYLEDDHGQRYLPEGLDHATTQLLVQMWDTEVRTVQRNQFGDITAVNDDGWRRRQPLSSLAVFRGRGDFVFYKRDLFRRDLRSLRLVVHHPGETFEFTWTFTDSVASTSAD
jgi:hypothetical protein